MRENFQQKKPIDMVWLQKQFRQLHSEHALILKRVRSPHFDFAVGPVTNKKQKEKRTMLEINLTNEQQVNVTLKPETATGRPATVDGVPTWEVITGNATVTPAADGLSADLISADDPGDTDFLVKADADLGEGVTEISDIVRLHVAGAQAASLGLKAGDPTNK